MSYRFKCNDFCTEDKLTFLLLSCKTDDSQVTALRSPTCQGDPCRVPIGGFASLEMEFVPQTDAKNISINVFASVFGFEVSLPLDDTDACASGRLNCPVKAGVPQTLKYELVVKDTYYPVAGDVGFRLTSEDGATIACASISAELYAPNEDDLKFPEEEKDVDHQEL